MEDKTIFIFSFTLIDYFLIPNIINPYYNHRYILLIINFGIPQNSKSFNLLLKCLRLIENSNLKFMIIFKNIFIKKC
jgi:hypothetical protein